jgi:hypothetical protein
MAMQSYLSTHSRIGCPHHITDGDGMQPRQQAACTCSRPSGTLLAAALLAATDLLGGWSLGRAPQTAGDPAANTHAQVAFQRMRTNRRQTCHSEGVVVPPPNAQLLAARPTTPDDPLPGPAPASEQRLPVPACHLLQLACGVITTCRHAATLICCSGRAHVRPPK